MNLVPVSSSNLKAVGYELSTKTMQAAFLNGEVYEYIGVPAFVYIALMAARSHNTYFETYIKNRYCCFLKLQ